MCLFWKSRLEIVSVFLIIHGRGPKVRALFVRVLSGGNGCCPGRINARGGLPVHQAVWRCARLARGYSPAFRHRAHCHWNNSKQMRTMMEDCRWQKGTHFCLWISSSHIDLWNTPYSFCFLLPQWQESLQRQSKQGEAKCQYHVIILSNGHFFVRRGDFYIGAKPFGQALHPLLPEPGWPHTQGTSLTIWRRSTS